MLEERLDEIEAWVNGLGPMEEPLVAYAAEQIVALILEIRRVRTMATDAIEETYTSGEEHWLRTLCCKPCDDPDCHWASKNWHPK